MRHHVSCENIIKVNLMLLNNKVFTELSWHVSRKLEVACAAHFSYQKHLQLSCEIVKIAPLCRK